MTGFGGRKDWIAAAANAAGLAISAAAVLLVSVILANGAGAASVGQFNQLAAVYIVASQLAALGVHLSILHFIPVTAHGERATAAQAAVLAIIPAAGVTAVIVWAAAPMIEIGLDSPGLSAGIELVAIASCLFALSKLLLSLLNVFDHLVWLSIAQALRPIIWVVAVVLLLVAAEISAHDMGAILVFGEVAVIAFALVRLAPILLVRGAGKLGPWISRHLRFGFRAFPSNAITELNTRIDVLILGIFASDQIVGIYSFAALIAEGVFQIGVITRTIVNNRLVEAVVTRDSRALATLWRSVGRVAIVFSVIVAMAAYVLTPLLIDWFRLDPSLHQGSLVLGMLLVGVVGSSRFAPFWNVLLLAGRPGSHSLLMLAVLAINLVLNVVAIPIAGMNGAGAATAATFLIFPFLLRFASRSVLGLRLGGHGD